MVEIDTDRSLFEEAGIRSVRIRFASILVGKPQNQKTIVLRPNDSSETQKIAIYHDHNQPIVYQVSWYSNKGRIEEKLQRLEDGYLYLIPPDKEQFSEK